MIRNIENVDKIYPFDYSKNPKEKNSGKKKKESGNKKESKTLPKRTPLKEIENEFLYSIFDVRV